VRVVRRRVFAVVFIVVAAGACGLIWTALPPRALDAAAPDWSGPPVAAGSIHIHTDRSDGSGSVDAVAQAAALAGLQFIVVTDHGDATHIEPPAYRAGVLVIDGVEISTTRGHYAAIGLAPSPYPLGGEAREVAEDVARLGGFGFVTHGDSPKPELRWSDWAVPFDGLEVLNLDTAWRLTTGGRLARAMTTYWLRGPETLGSLIARPGDLLDHWDAAATTRRVVGLASLDAHGGFVPSYRTCFRTLTTRVELDRPLTGDAEADARAIVDSLRTGRHYMALDAFGRSPRFAFTASVDSQRARQGDALPDGSPVRLDVRTAEVEGVRIRLLRDGVAVRTVSGSHLTYVADGGRTAYRAEVFVPASDRAQVPWILSNPIYVGDPNSPAGSGLAPGGGPTLAIRSDSWHTEHEPTSEGAIESAGGGLRFRFRVGRDASHSPFSAIGTAPAVDLRPYDRVTVTATADQPLRLLVMFRARGDDDPPRWARSVYLDRTPRTYTLPLSDLRPVTPHAAAVAPLETVGTLLLVVDSVNTTPGTAGSIEIGTVAFGSPAP
jgi:hypothetical protein